MSDQKSVTEQEKQDRRAQIDALLLQQFGENHGCSLDVGPLLRVHGATTVRFAHGGEHWDLKFSGTTFELARAG